MEYTKLGNSELNVSRICMGCMGFGEAGNGQHSWTIDEEHSREIIKKSLALGVNFFDTAIAYQSGTSEQYLGRAIKDFARREDNIAMTPYSALAGGRLSKRPGETSKRLQEDSYAHLKYDATAEQDSVIINRVAQFADKYGVSMTEISLAWLLTKVTSPVVGATKLHHIEGAARAVSLALTADELAFLEEPYVPHNLVGVMAQNTPAAAKEKHVWSVGSQKI